MEYNIRYIGYSGYTMEYIKYMGFRTYPNQFKHIVTDFAYFWRFGSYIFQNMVLIFSQKPIRRPPPILPTTILAIYSETKPRDHSHENRLEKLV